VDVAARRYQELLCWQLAMQVYEEVVAFTANPPAGDDREFCQAIREAAISAPKNIAEGFGRYTHRDFANFLRVARSSLLETQTALRQALVLKFIGDDQYTRLLSLSERAIAATTRLQSYLRTTHDPGPRKG
jgi:four helix bundle protein